MKGSKKSSWMLIAAMHFVLQGVAQKQNNFWFFGKNAGLDFSSGAAVAITGSLDQEEGSAAVSDSAGKLLFYTNGKKVWDKNNAIMPNGTGLWGGGSTIQTLILPQPGCDKGIYYIFTNDECSNMSPNDRFAYTVVDMKKNGGLGEVDTTRKNKFLFSKSTEGVTAVRHSNGIDAWIIAHKQNSNAFYVYALTSSGMDTIPKIYKIGSSDYDCQSTLKASPDGTKIIAIHSSSPVPAVTAELLDFNASSGVISNVVALGAHQGAFATSFSPDSKKVYIGYVNKDHIDQFDLSNSSGSAITSSHTAVFTSTSPQPAIYGMQLAPDGKIYFTKLNKKKWLGVINNPNLSGTACNVVLDALDISPNQSDKGFVNLFDGFLNTVIPPDVTVNLGSDQTICFGQTVALDANNSGSSYWWSTGETAQSISLLPSVSANYAVTVTQGGCTDIDSVTIVVDGIVTAFAASDTSGPAALTVSFTNNSVNAVSYSWWFDDGETSNEINPQHVFQKVGSYLVKLVAYNASGCSDVAYKVIDVNGGDALYIPEAFTPNNDGINDRFEITVAEIKNYTVSIYNRWGEKMYQWSQSEKGWDGRSNGADPQEGVYVYSVDATSMDGRRYKKSGKLVLIK